MIKIGIVARLSYDCENVATFDIREPNLRNAVIKAGGTPFLLLPQQNLKYQDYKMLEVPKITEKEKEQSIELLKMCDGLILPGGDEWTYLDELAVEYAIKTRTPILGICLGMQLMGIDKDFSRMKKLPNKSHQSKNQYVHSIEIQENSKLYEIIKEKEIKVNSRHIHTIEPTDNWMITATSEDDVMEAIEVKNHPFCIGVQWHPEDLIDDQNSEKLFTSFIEACKN